MAHKLTVEISDEVEKVLRDIAKRRNVTLKQALGQAIATEKFLSDEIEAGAKVLLEKDKKIERVVFQR